MSFVRDLRVAFNSLIRTPGLAIAVVLTLSLGIGANAAIFTLVRGVLLKPLVNRGEDRLIYVRQSAPGIGNENSTFSVPEIQDLRSSVKTVSAFGDFSTMDFTMIGLGEPRSIRGGVVGGNYFEVMGLRPVLGRLIGPEDDGPKAAGVVVLTYRFWATAFHKDPSVLGKTVRLGSLGDRSATVIGVLEPCVPYPQDTEIIANVGWLFLTSIPRFRERLLPLTRLAGHAGAALNESGRPRYAPRMVRSGRARKPAAIAAVAYCPDRESQVGKSGRNRIPGP